jgi:hypothetical protein
MDSLCVLLVFILIALPNLLSVHVKVLSSVVAYVLFGNFLACNAGVILGT